MGALAALGERLVTDFLTRIDPSGFTGPRLMYIPYATSAASQCVDVNGQDTQHDTSFDYCPADDAVYVGQEILWDTSRRYGAAGPISGLAHEYGHALQSARQVPDPVGPAETIRHENQADCISGAFVGDLRARGEFGHPTDLARIKQYLIATASAEGPERDHGTAAERVGSFELGYTGALPACNGFYPAAPLVG